MVTTVNAHAGAWLDGVTVAGQDLRLQLASAMLTGASPSGSTGIAARPGVRYGTGSPLLVQAASGMNITINAGVAFVQGTSSATAGMYTCCLDTTATLTVATSDPTNPRIDNVICQITDVGTSGSTTVVTLQTGTPAPSPVAPTLPANSLLLAQIAVGAAVSSISGGNIADSRVYTSATGGITPVANTSGGITGGAGLYVHNLGSGRMQVSDGAGNARAPKTAAFTPVTTIASGLGGATFGVNPGASATIATASINVDGATEIKIEGITAGVYQVINSEGDFGTLLFQLDGTTINSGQFNWSQDGTGSLNNWLCAGTFTVYTTPAAGSHTITWKLTNDATSSQPVHIANGSAAINPVLRVGPAFN